MTVGLKLLHQTPFPDSKCAQGALGSSLALQCPPGGMIQAFEFASFGNPNGMCGAYKPGTCHVDATSIIEEQCKGKHSCSIDVNAEVFKHECSVSLINGPPELRVQITCSGLFCWTFP